MCRLLVYVGPPIHLADLTLLPNRSIVKQSFASRERLTDFGYLNGDGFGVGWYSRDSGDDGSPCVFVSNEPAWNNTNLARLSKKVRATLFFAHVRAATPGLAVGQQGSHPFTYGRLSVFFVCLPFRFLWMHNGNIAHFDKVCRPLLSTLSEEMFRFAISKTPLTDSALAFAIFINKLPNGANQVYRADVLYKALLDTIETITTAVRDHGGSDACLLNFVVSDGATVLAARYAWHSGAGEPTPATLYYSFGTKFDCRNGTAPSFLLTPSLSLE